LCVFEKNKCFQDEKRKRTATMFAQNGNRDKDSLLSNSIEAKQIFFLGIKAAFYVVWDVKTFTLPS
jgi:hypothetical protein